jgi:lipopolysaccharide biosynthesis glycosyltransferase
MSAIENLSEENWLELQSLYDQILDTEELSEYVPDEKNGNKIVLGYHTTAKPLNDLMRFFYDHKLIIDFDWSNWEEGREIAKRDGKDKFNDLDEEKTLKLFTAIMRNDRFSEGAYARFFESGDGELLLKRLLEFRK